MIPNRGQLMHGIFDMMAGMWIWSILGLVLIVLAVIAIAKLMRK